MSAMEEFEDWIQEMEDRIEDFWEDWWHSDGDFDDNPADGWDSPDE